MKTGMIAIALGAAAMGLASAAASAQDNAQTSATANSGAGYSVATTKVATLLDDPAAAAVLEALIPAVYANEMFQTMGRDQTLKAIQQYEPADLSDENLARIQAELDKLPAPSGG